jgi:phytoene desaturase
MADQEPIVIIGAGIGGLSLAIRLAVQGKSVIVFEKNPQVGGKMAEFRYEGFRWDLGPTFITMRDVFEDLFHICGKKMHDHIQLIPIDPIRRYFFADGKRLDIRRDLALTLENISSLSETGVEEYLSFLAYASRQYRITAPIFTYGPPPSFSKLAAIKMRDLLKVDAFRDLNSAIQEFTSSKYLRQLFGRFAIYAGANPFKTPAILSVIAHVDLSRGVWYPRGGVHSVAQTLERLAIEKGVSIKSNTEVKRIIVYEREARGVELVNGAVIETGTVVSNVDIATTYSSLLPQKPPYTWELANYKDNPTTMSAFILLLGVKGRHHELSHHNIFFSENYQKEFNQIFKQGIPPDDPTIYIAITSKNDMIHAPTGHENWYVSVNVPPVSDKFDWLNQAEAYKRMVLAKISQKGIDLTDQIVFEKVITPVDLEQMTGAYRGSIYGIAYDNWQSFFKRPKPQPKVPAGLYFVGGTTHPGGGVPLVVLSGKYVAELIMGKQ